METQETPINQKKEMKHILSLLLQHKFKLSIAVICAIISTLFTVISPLLIGDAITIIFNGSTNILNHTGGMDIDALIKILTITTILYVISSLFSYLQGYCIAEISSKISYSLREKMINKVVNLPMTEIDENKRGDILSRITNDVDYLSSGITESFLGTLTSAITLIGTLFVMISINIWMAILVVLIIPISVILIRSVTTVSQKYFHSQLKNKGELNSHIEETITNQDAMRAFNYEKISIEHFDQSNDDLYNDEWKSSFISSLMMPLMKLVENIEYVAIAVVGSIFVLQGAMPVGRIVSFFEYSENFIAPIEEFTIIMTIVQMALASSSRIFEFLEFEDEENSSSKQVPQFSDEITFENVNFGYLPDVKIIDDFSLTVKKGQKIAIVGETGAGKSTIVKLLMKFYDIDSGEIKIDGVNIDEYDKHSLRSMIGMVLQDSWLFYDTIENNIQYGNPDATKEELINASKQANTDNFIKQLPDGYETYLTEDSDNISHGQKQLLTIARTIISNKEILILDEATSSVDTRTEKLIQNTMGTLIENTTCFIIAHRLSTIRNADNIIVLENGRIIEQGKHDELIAKKGYYYNTLTNQTKLN